jgi:hypothetical protein
MTETIADRPAPTRDELAARLRAKREADDEAAIDALAQADAIQRERERATAELAEYRDGLRTELAAKEAARLDAVEKAEAAARQLVASLSDVLSISADMRAIIRKLDGRVAMALEDGGTVNRMSMRLAAVLRTFAGHRNRFGMVEWRDGVFASAENWRDAEQVNGATALNSINKGT